MKELEKIAKKAADVDADKASKKLASVKKKQTEVKQLRGIFEQADKVYRQDLGETWGKLKSKGKEITAAYHQYVQDNFDACADKVKRALRAKVASSADTAAKAPAEVQQPPGSQQPQHRSEIRCVEVPLARIFRDDLDNDDKEHFMVKCQEAAIATTDHVSELSVAVRAMMLRMTSHGFKKDRNGITLNTKKAKGLPLLDLVPESVIRGTDYDVQEEIPVAPLPATLTKETDFAPLSDLFAQQHIQYIHSHALSDSGTTYTKNTLWDRLLVRMDKQLQHAPSNMSNILKVAVQQYATNLDNMWSTGRLFHMALDRLLLMTLRFKLALEREARCKAISETCAKEKDAKKEDKQAQGPCASQRRQELRAETKYFNKCLKKANTDDEELSTKWLSRAMSSRERLQVKYDAHKQTNAKLAARESVLHVNKEARAVDSLLSSGSTADEAADHIMWNEDSDEENEDEDESEETKKEDLPKETSMDKGQNQDPREPPSKRQKTAEKECSRRRISQLKAVAKKMLLGGDCSEEKLEEFWNGTQLSDKERDALMETCEVLKPYTPPEGSPNCPALMLPIVMISNSVQRATGYASFSKDICPYISPASIYTLHLDAAALYELFGSDAGAYFLHTDANTRVISAKQARNNKLVLYQNFFGVNKIDDILSKHGLRFDDLVEVTPHDTAILHGVVLDCVSLSTSAYEKRVESKGKKQGSSFNIAPPAQAVENIAEVISSLEMQHRSERKQASKADHDVKQIKHSRKRLSPGEERTRLYKELKDAKARRGTYEVAASKTLTDLKSARHQKYLQDKSKGNRKSIRQNTKRTKEDQSDDDSEELLSEAPENKTTPRLAQPACEDAISHISFKGFLEDIEEVGMEPVFTGTDYGLRTMSTTVAFTKEQYISRIKLYNRFQALEECEDDEEEGSESPPCPSMPEPFIINHGQIDQLSLSRTHARKRCKRKAKNKAVQDAEQVLAKNSIKHAKSDTDILKRQKFARETRDTLRSFYHSKRAHREKRAQNLRTNYTYDKLAADERKYATNHARNSAPPMMAVGTEGTCVGSRLKGTKKRGGKQLRRRHRRYTCICMTSEYNSSQTCVVCFKRVKRPKARRFVRGKWRWVSVHGASVCMNPQCPSYKNGTNTQNRDVQAALAIGLSAATQLIHGYTLHCFDASHSYTGQMTSHRAVPVQGTSQVSVPTDLPSSAYNVRL